jgi:hypothetical protein
VDGLRDFGVDAVPLVAGLGIGFSPVPNAKFTDMEIINSP